MSADTPTRQRFGTFGGVFTPSILTILGVIMFMRANYVVGQSGIVYALAILCIAKSITLLTTFSVSAISTNMQVGGGGAYFMISRVLGREFGGAVGIALFFALALSVPFYIIGFTEALLGSFPALAPYSLPVTLITASLLFIVAYVGASWAIRAQFFIMAVLVLAILSFSLGMLEHFSWAQFYDNLWPYDPANFPEHLAQTTTPLAFWVVFAIYFPAVTGIDAGVNMSGDLEDPGKSIPNGTFAAVGVGFLVYASQAVLAGGAFPRLDESGMDLLREPYRLLHDNAALGSGVLVAGGVFAATLSSALGSYLSGPRVLQAISRDPVLPFLRPFGKGAGDTNEPRRALWLVFALTIGVLLWAHASSGGDALNAVAAVVTMFFLFSYGTINAAAFLEAVGDNPSFRPRFKYFHWSVALLGAVGCIAVAALINAVAALIAALLIAGLIKYVAAMQLRATFGDARRGFFFAAVRDNLFRLAEMDEDSRNWRPTAVVFSGNPAHREEEVRYASWLESGRGLVYLAHVLNGDIVELAPRRRAALQQLRAFCKEKQIRALPVAAVAPTLTDGVSALLQAAAVGPIRPNLAVFGWSHHAETIEEYARQLRIAASMHISLVLLRVENLPATDIPRRIDMWWRGQSNGSLMMLLAHLMSQSPAWMGTTIRVLRVIDSEAGREPALKSLQGLVDSARVNAQAVTIVSERPFPELLRTHSSDATCIFLGFALPESGTAAVWQNATSNLLEGLPATILVSAHAGEDMLA